MLIAHQGDAASSAVAATLVQYAEKGLTRTNVVGPIDMTVAHGKDTLATNSAPARYEYLLSLLEKENNKPDVVVNVVVMQKITPIKSTLMKPPETIDTICELTDWFAGVGMPTYVCEGVLWDGHTATCAAFGVPSAVFIVDKQCAENAALLQTHIENVFSRLVNGKKTEINKQTQ